MDRRAPEMLIIYLFWPITEINYKHVVGAGILRSSGHFSTLHICFWGMASEGLLFDLEPSRRL